VKHVFHQYTVRITGDFSMSRDQLRKKLLDKRIGTEVYYPLPVHKQPLYRSLGYNDHLPNAEQAAGEVLSLPVHPSVTKEDLENIVRAIQAI
jgi:perosamine synthetase